MIYQWIRFHSVVIKRNKPYNNDKKFEKYINSFIDK